MSKFVTAMDNGSKLTLGENGMPEYESTSEDMLDFFFKLVRDLSVGEIRYFISKILDTRDCNQVADLFVLTFQTRDCRGGKGEKMLSRKP